MYYFGKNQQEALRQYHLHASSLHAGKGKQADPETALTIKDLCNLYLDYQNKQLTATGGVYAYDYDLFELFAEFGTEIARLPLAVFGDYVRNTVADDEDTGWLVGLQVNRAKDPGSWQFEWDYRDLETDAVVAQFTHSDFVGGGTGGKGHRFAFGYMLAKNVATNVTYYRNEFSRPGTAADGEKYDRVQVDLALRF